MLTNAVAPSEGPRHQTQYYLDLVKIFSASIAAPSIEIQATSEERAGARRLLSAEGVPREAKFLVLNPGAAYGSAKRWHLDRFAEVADSLAYELQLHIVLIGSQQEWPFAEQIRNRMKAPAAILTGRTSLEALIGVLAESSLMITND